MSNSIITVVVNKSTIVSYTFNIIYDYIYDYDTDEISMF